MPNCKAHAGWHSIANHVIGNLFILPYKYYMSLLSIIDRHDVESLWLVEAIQSGMAVARGFWHNKIVFI
jgi:hypothetical protein